MPLLSNENNLTELSVTNHPFLATALLIIQPQETDGNLAKNSIS